MLSRFSRVRLFVTPWTVARHAPPSMEFSRQEYWNGLPLPPPGDRPDPGNQTHVSCASCIGRQVLYHWCHLGSPAFVTKGAKSPLLEPWGERTPEKKLCQALRTNKETTPPQRSPEKPEKGPWFHLSLLECFFFSFFFFFPFLQMAAFNEEALSAKIGNLQPGCSQGVHPPSAVRREHHCSAGGLRPLR